MSLAAPASRSVLRANLSRDDLMMRAGVVVLAGMLLLIVGLPLWALLAKGFEDRDGKFIGLANYLSYFSTPALFNSALNSFEVAAAVTLIVVPLAFLYAYALTRAVLPTRWLFQGISLIPIFAPSLLPGLALVYLFGNQGFFKGMLGGPIYGFDGILIAQVFYCFPHATLILVTALATADARLYEAADALGASKIRVFFTVTLPGAKYGLISAALVVFTLVITDFGIAKVIGGNFNVLATDVYKQVIGQQNFSMGAVVGMVLLAPAALAFVVDRFVQRKQVALLTARAVPLIPKPKFGRDVFFTAFCTVISCAILGILGMAAWGSLIKYWPYNLSLTLANYQFANFDANGWDSYFNSLRMAAGAAIFGTLVMFVGAWLNEKTKGFGAVRGIVQLLAFLPMAVPGIVLGLGYIFFFNAPSNPLNFLYATMAILVINTVAHYYTVGHLTATTALKQIDPEFESVSASLKVPVWRTFVRVTAPICLPAILDIAIYLFVNAMTTVSSVIFLYAPDTKLASVAAVNIEEAGTTAAAAALCIVIVITSATVKAHAHPGRPLPAGPSAGLAAALTASRCAGGTTARYSPRFCSPRGPSMKQLRIPAVYMRGGTSKGVFFLAEDLPSDQQARDRILMRVIGSPDRYGKHTDGMGGATSSTSKVVILAKSKRRIATSITCSARWRSTSRWSTGRATAATSAPRSARSRSAWAWSARRPTARPRSASGRPTSARRSSATCR